MTSFDQLLEREIGTYEGRHDDLIFQAPAFYRLLTKMLDDPMLPRRQRPLVIAAIAYFVLPYDVLPEEIYGPYGYLDDIFLSAFVADKVRKESGSEEILTGNWDGEADILALVDEILQRESELIGEMKEKILRYIGYEYLGSVTR
jgi:uncharacterized membrane protein YkvA (DUF1232 family)